MARLLINAKVKVHLLIFESLLFKCMLKIRSHFSHARANSHSNLRMLFACADIKQKNITRSLVLESNCNIGCMNLIESRSIAIHPSTEANRDSWLQSIAI